MGGKINKGEINRVKMRCEINRKISLVTNNLLNDLHSVHPSLSSSNLKTALSTICFNWNSLYEV